MLRNKGLVTLQKSVSVSVQRTYSNKNRAAVGLIDHPVTNSKKNNPNKKNLLASTQVKKDKRLVPTFLGAPKKIKTGRKFKTSGEAIHLQKRNPQSKTSSENLLARTKHKITNLNSTSKALQTKAQRRDKSLKFGRQEYGSVQSNTQCLKRFVHSQTCSLTQLGTRSLLNDKDNETWNQEYDREETFLQPLGLKTPIPIMCRLGKSKMPYFESIKLVSQF